jgi:hypothetical protein
MIMCLCPATVKNEFAWGARRPFGTDSPPCPPRGLRPRPRRRRTIAGGFGEAGVVGKVQVPKSPKGEASGVGVAGGGPKGEANPLRVPM